MKHAFQEGFILYLKITTLYFSKLRIYQIPLFLKNFQNSRSWNGNTSFENVGFFQLMRKLVKLQRTIGFNQFFLSITNSREMATRQFIKRNFCEKTCQIAKDNFLTQSAVEKKSAKSKCVNFDYPFGVLSTRVLYPEISWPINPVHSIKIEVIGAKNASELI